MKKLKTSISLDDETLDKLRIEAQRQRRSVSQLIEIYLEEALAVQQSLREQEATTAGN